MNSEQIKQRRLVIDQMLQRVESTLEAELEVLQQVCPHLNTEMSKWCGTDIGIDCSDCGKVLLDPYCQDILSESS